MQIPATPKSLIDPPAPPVPVKTLSRWTQFLGEIAAGSSVQDAMMKYFMKRADIEACIRSSSEERARWEDAKLSALKKKWSGFVIDDILRKISGGMPIGESVMSSVGGSDQSQIADFTYLCSIDTELHELYIRACRSRAILTGEDILKIADEDGNDTLPGPKGGEIPNNAAVNRSKLQVDSRRFLMGSWFPKLFGEKQTGAVTNIQINYAERLEEARARAAGRKPTVRITQDVVDAAFKELPKNEDWDDVPKESIDTTWLETE